MPIDDPHNLKPENRSSLWRARHLNIHWEDRTLLYFNRIVEQWDITEFHAKREKDGQWSCWWKLADKQGDIGKTKTKTFGMSLLGCITYLYRNWPFTRVTKKRKETHIIQEFFEGVRRSLGSHLNLKVPPVKSKDRYATKFYQSPDWGGREAKIAGQKQVERRKQRKEYIMAQINEDDPNASKK